MSRPKENWPPHTIHLPMHHRLSPYLPPLLEFLYVYGACEIWKTSGGAARRHTDAMIGGTAQTFPKVSCLAHKFSLQGVKHFKGVGLQTKLPGRRERTYICLIIILFSSFAYRIYLMVRATNQIFVKMNQLGQDFQHRVKVETSPTKLRYSTHKRNFFYTS